VNYPFKGLVHPKNEKPVIYYSPEHKLRYFWWNLRDSSHSIYSVYIVNPIHMTWIEHHWFTHVKRTCLSFSLLQLIYVLINVYMWIKAYI